MCAPDYFTIRDVKNPFMQAAVPVDRDRAAAQWAALRAAFELAGLHVATIEAVPDLEDMTFAANPVFAGSGRVHERFVVPSRMRYASRAREVPHYVAWFERRGFAVLEAGIEDGDYLEGFGDLIPHPGRAHIWAGYGYRSTRGGVERAARLLQPEGLHLEPLRLTHPTFYHLDTCFAPLSEDAALCFSPAFAPDSLDALRRTWKRLYDVPPDDALRFACNGVVAGGRYVVSQASPWLQATLARESLTPLATDLSEFEKSGGSAFCLKAAFEDTAIFSSEATGS
jgi:arginine dihydrolase